ncbi:hypothetical protein BKA62DRAFT_709932 [Auriculariales sp. MPI-PUGE-AT-0066]|nr:hypothetical protein BKA62DRAFT_709932 [Auriculariales sp. MPI-PUGE-AT-0066]
MFSRSPYFVTPSAQPGYYEREPSQDDLARARYLRALQEQRTARQAYADALAEREVQRLEDQYSSNPYVRMNRELEPESEPAQPFLTGDVADEDYGFVHPRIQRQQEIESLRRAEKERLRRQLELEEHDRRAAAEEARRARQAAYEAEHRAIEEERRRRAQRYHAQQEQVSITLIANDALARLTYHLQYLNPFAGMQPPRQAPNSAGASTSANRSPRTPHTEFASQPQSQRPTTTQSPALSTIAEISAAAAELQNSFRMPTSLEFSSEDDTKPKLSYASANKPIRVYEDALSKLLEKLDAVESAGIVVKDIERALEQLEGQVEGAWKKQQHQEDDHSNVGSSDGFEMVDPATPERRSVSRTRAASSASSAPPLTRSRAGSTTSAAPAASER